MWSLLSNEVLNWSSLLKAASLSDMALVQSKKFPSQNYSRHYLFFRLSLAIRKRSPPLDPCLTRCSIYPSVFARSLNLRPSIKPLNPRFCSPITLLMSPLQTGLIDLPPGPCSSTGLSVSVCENVVLVVAEVAVLVEPPELVLP